MMAIDYGCLELGDRHVWRKFFRRMVEECSRCGASRPLVAGVR